MSFDEHSTGYSEEVSAALRFSGRDHDFFWAAKIRNIERVHAELAGAGTVRTLEIGCGVGLLQHRLRSRFGAVFGLDPSVSSLAVARAGASGRDAARLVAADGLRMPFADDSFGLVLMVNVLHHVPVAARDAFLREALRVLQPSGRLLICEHNPWNPFTRRAVRNCAFDRGVVLLRRRALCRRLEAAGMSEVRRRYIHFLPWAGGGWDRVEDLLAPLPFGAQYLLEARRR